MTTEERISSFKKNPAPIRSKKKIGLSRGLSLVICVIMMISALSIAGCSKSDKEFNDVWPSIGLTSRLPKPASEKIHVNSNSETGLRIDVGETDESAFKSYIAACQEKGFTEKFDTSETRYSADDKEGYSLILHFYDDDKTMEISLSAPQEETETKKPTETKKEETKAEETKPKETKPKETKAPEKEEKNEKDDSNTTDTSFRELMDEYEAFIDDYVSFMKDYNNSDDIMGMMNDYTKWLTDYSEWVEKIDEVNTDDLSAADLAYYTEVMGRVSEKLASVY